MKVWSLQTVCHEDLWTPSWTVHRFCLEVGVAAGAGVEAGQIWEVAPPTLPRKWVFPSNHSPVCWRMCPGSLQRREARGWGAVAELSVETLRTLRCGEYTLPI